MGRRGSHSRAGWSECLGEEDGDKVLGSGLVKGLDYIGGCRFWALLLSFAVDPVMCDICWFVASFLLSMAK